MDNFSKEMLLNRRIDKRIRHESEKIVSLCGGQSSSCPIRTALVDQFITENYSENGFETWLLFAFIIIAHDLTVPEVLSILFRYTTT